MLKEFFRDKSAARLLIIAATLVLLISQFFYYFNDALGASFLDPGSTTRSSVLYRDFSAPGVVTGWEVHPHAYIILLVLAFALLRDDVAGERWFDRFGYWVCLILIIAATIPGAYFQAKGAGLGAVAIVMALVAALMNHVSKKSSAPAGNNAPT